MRIVIVIAFIIAAAAIGFGQDTPPITPTFESVPISAVTDHANPPVGALTTDQRKILTGDLAIAKLAQIDFQNAIASLQADAEAVKRANGWPAGTPL